MLSKIIFSWSLHFYNRPKVHSRPGDYCIVQKKKEKNVQIFDVNFVVYQRLLVRRNSFGDENFINDDFYCMQFSLLH